jgi:pimeloyl-ACP methyl ester carboxylesterase
MEPEELTLDLPMGLRVAALAWGPEDGVRVLALHGWLDNAASFARLAPLLEGVRTVALDLPGHGRSDHFPRGWVHHFVDWVPVVLEAADALGWSRFDLLGHSMGAGISSLVPSAAPGRVRRMVLVEGLGPLSGPAEGASERFAAALEDEAQLAQRPGRGPFPDVENAVRARMRGTDLEPDAARLLVDRGVDVTADGVRFRHDPRMKLRSRLRMTEEQVCAFLAAIACPVLVIRASQGFPFPEDEGRARLMRIRDCRVVDVEGDHHVHLTAPERVTPIVTEFVVGERDHR